MFIDNIDNIHNQDVYTKINFLDQNTQNIKTNNFFQFFQKSLGNINNIQGNVQKNIKNIELNPSSVSLNDVMIDLQKSSISIELAIQIRNKITSAYKEIMSQQI